MMEWRLTRLMMELAMVKRAMRAKLETIKRAMKPFGYG
jgi:hypothetical protein